jgi:YesN/AraC family two-component response regulator
MKNNKKPSVLVVDDDHMMREMLKLILHSDDYQVLGEAANGKNAITLCTNLKPGLVLLDINMPEMDGLQALEEIRKISPATKVIMVSAEATMDRVSEAIKKGAVGFVVKPLNATSVLGKIESCFRKGGLPWRTS